MDPRHCDSNAECINTNGSFYCNCNPGFEGDGYNCLSKVNLTREGGESQGSPKSADQLAVILGTVGGVIAITIMTIVVVIVLIKVRKRKKEQNGDQQQETRYLIFQYVSYWVSVIYTISSSATE